MKTVNPCFATLLGGIIHLAIEPRSLRRNIDIFVTGVGCTALVLMELPPKQNLWVLDLPTGV